MIIMRTHAVPCAACWIALVFQSLMVSSQTGYAGRERHIEDADFNERILPAIPASGEKIRVIIDTDAKNEIDDQWAVTLALLSSDRFEIEGFIAANFDNSNGGPDGIDKSYQELKLLLKKSGFEGQYPVYKGSHPMRYKYEPSPSEGVDFIIQKAMESTPSDPIWVVALGSATNLASAYLKQPEIRDRVRFFWHGRTRWPEKCWNFNVFGDRHAAMILFHAPVPLVLFDTGTYLTCPMEESEKHVLPYGEIGRYLHEYRYTNPYFMRIDKGFFDLGDIAALVDPDIALWQEASCPEVDPDMSYRFKGTKGEILRCYYIDRDAAFRLLYDRLNSHYPAGDTR
jgi:purine nucleosidase